MRADRLLSIMLLLQRQGRMTAQQLATAMEVSERTIYRDIDALTTAGVPIYAEYRRGGGYELLENYRMTLTGLNDDEVRALFMLSIPAPLNALGQSEALRRALLKLSAALPSTRQEDELRVRQRIHLDSTWWFQGGEAMPFLQVIQQAVWEDREIGLRYEMPLPGNAVIEQTVAPYGLVAKAGVWYLVYGYRDTIRAKRIARLLDVQLLPSTFERPAGFDLGAFWTEWCASFEHDRPQYVVTVRVAPTFMAELPRHLGYRIERQWLQPSATDPDGWVRLSLPFEWFEEARQRLLGCGRGVEVIAPEALRLSILDFAAQIVALYGGRGDSDDP